MRFCSNLRFAELLFASAFGVKRVGTVSKSTKKWDGNSAYVLAPTEATHQPTDLSERPRCGGNKARTGGQRHATIEDGTTRRDEAAKKSAD